MIHTVTPPPSSVAAPLLPDLRIMHVADMVPHEQADPRRVARLSERLRRDGILKNPVIVAPMPDGERAVVLDGANRTAALQAVGARDALVQRVDYHDPALRLLTWNHLVTGLPPTALLDQIRAIDELTIEPVTLDTARAALAARDILAYVLMPPNGTTDAVAVYMISGPAEAVHSHSDTHLLLRMVDIYKGKPDTAIHRVADDDLAAILPYYDGVSGLLVFPPYTPDDILHLAGHGLRVPTGITRHIIPARALRVNVPLALLTADTPLAEKNAWWLERVKARLADNEIRFYQESTYLFDE